MSGVAVKAVGGGQIVATIGELRKKYPEAVAAGINRTTQSAAVAARSVEARLLGVKVGSLRKMVKQSRRATASDPSGSVRFLNFNLPITAMRKYSGRRGRLPFSGLFATSKAGELKELPNKPFWQTMKKAGVPSVFTREGKERLPIKKVYIGSPRKAYESSPVVSQAVQQVLDTKLARDIAGQISRFSKKA